MSIAFLRAHLYIIKWGGCGGYKGANIANTIDTLSSSSLLYSGRGLGLSGFTCRDIFCDLKIYSVIDQSSINGTMINKLRICLSTLLAKNENVIVIFSEY